MRSAAYTSWLTEPGASVPSPQSLGIASGLDNPLSASPQRHMVSLHVLQDAHPQCPSLPKHLETIIRTSCAQPALRPYAPQLPSAKRAEGRKKYGGAKTTVCLSKNYSATLKNALMELSWDLFITASRTKKDLDGTHRYDANSISQNLDVSLWKQHEATVCHKDSVYLLKHASSTVQGISQLIKATVARRKQN